MSPSDNSRRMTVDGELWEVTFHDGQYDFTWLAGKAPGYGFASRLSDPDATLSPERIEQTIREFMSDVNPETGYLD